MISTRTTTERASRRWRFSTLAAVCSFVAFLGLSSDAQATTFLDASVVGAGPYYLESSGETYVLTEDITTVGSAIVFAADNVVLDLNQHTVSFGSLPEVYRYGIVIPPPYPHANPMWSQSDIAIWRRASGATIRNGSVVQGLGNGANCAAIIGYGQADVSIEGLSVLITGDDTFAIQLAEFSNMRVFGNTITDSTTVITNRHAGRAAIDIMAATDGPIEVYGNTIRNCRQWGIRISRRTPTAVWGHIYGNLIYPNTITTNGYGIGLHGAMLEAYDNTIQATNGRGIHIENWDRFKVFNNEIDVIEQPFWDEYSRVSAHGIKLEGCTNAEIYGNHVISRGIVNASDAISNGSALNIAVGAGSDNYIHDNVFEAKHLGGTAFNPLDYNQFATAVEIITVAEGSNLRVEDNTFITHDRFFTATDWRGPNYPEPISAAGFLIARNTWTRESTTAPTRKYDIFFGYSSVTGLRFVDNAGEANFRNYGTAWPWKSNSWSVGYSGTVRTLEADGRPAPNTQVEIRNGLGDLVSTVTTDGTGEATPTLDEYLIFEEGYAGQHILNLEEQNPYEFLAWFGGEPRSEGSNINASGWQVEIRRDPAIPPVANFVGNPTSGDVPLAVTFTDQSTNYPASWSWAFGDGGTSTSQNPIHTYTAAGTYTVTLMATNAGGSDAETKTNYITVTELPPPPVANFVGSPTSGNAPLAVTFADQSTGTPTSWSWTFGDGDTSTTQNPNHSYTAAGTYTVTLTATNAGGSDAETRTNYITVSQLPPPPVANFVGSPTSGNAPLAVTFADQSTGNPTSWSWSFGDGGTATAQNPDHAYAAPGSYTVTLTATNAGGSDSETKTNYITVTQLPTPPVANFVGAPTSGNAPLAVTFTDQSTNAPTSWSWTFGDGGTATAQNPNHTYTAAGTYTVTLTATNAGGSDSETKTNYITVTQLPTPPVANFVGTPTSGNAPLAVTFTDQSTNAPTSWSWTFGDGGTSTTQNPNHTYAAAGTYTVTLTATNAGGSDAETKTNYITVTQLPTPPGANFVGTPTSGNAPLAVTFTDQSTNTPTSWSWSFGDGGTSTAQNPNHTYAAAGTYTVTLTATNAGGSDSETKTNYVTVTHPLPPSLAAFSATPLSGPAPLQVRFTDESTNSSNSWNWDFGDGGTSTRQNPTHTYSTPGVYTVTLAVASGGGYDSETKVGYITVEPRQNAPVAAFDATPTSGTAPLAVAFTDQTANLPTSWAWDFGDGGTSTLQNPSHTYSAAGSYTITLTASNEGGLDSETKSRWISVTHLPSVPTAAFTSDLTSGFAPLEVRFIDQSTNNPTTWAWSFGDGGTSDLPGPTHIYNVPGRYTVTLVAASSIGSDTYVRNRYIRVLEDQTKQSGGDRTLVLDQNQPNPAYGRILIPFSLPSEGHVRLEIYDLSGTRVARLMDGFFDPGEYAASWEDSECAAGSYFYRLEWQGQVRTRRLILIR